MCLVKQFEAWYLLAFSHFYAGNYLYSLEAIEFLDNSLKKTNSTAADIEDAARDLVAKINKIKEETGSLKNACDEETDAMD